MIELHVTHCCGVGEIDNLSTERTPLDAMKALYPQLITGLKPLGREYYGPKRVGAVFFTGVTKRRIGDHASYRMDDYGQAFDDFIVTNGLGSVVASHQFDGWTTNTLRLWVWTIDYTALKAWGEKMGLNAQSTSSL